MSQVTGATAPDPKYKSLYRLGGPAALVAVVLMVGVVIVFTIYPQPSTVSDWFEMFQRNKFIGLLDFWGLEILTYAMYALVFLALYFALRDADQGRMAIAIAFSLLGVGIFLATNNPFTMLSLSDQYNAATTDTQKTVLLAAGQAVLANTSQRVVGGFNAGWFLVSTAGLIASLVMLKSSSFGMPTAYVGILAWALSLIDYLRQILTQSAIITLLVILPSTLMLVAWFVLVGRRLWLMGHLGD